MTAALSGTRCWAYRHFDRPSDHGQRSLPGRSNRCGPPDTPHDEDVRSPPRLTRHVRPSAAPSKMIYHRVRHVSVNIVVPTGSQRLWRVERRAHQCHSRRSFCRSADLRSVPRVAHQLAVADRASNGSSKHFGCRPASSGDSLVEGSFSCVALATRGHRTDIKCDAPAHDHARSATTPRP